MSSSRRPDRRLRQRLRTLTLRAKLIVVLVGALAVICLIVGVVTELALGAHLVGRLDEQVRAAAARAAEFAKPPPGGRPPNGEGPANPGEARGLGPGTITAIVVNGQVDRADRQSVAAEPEPLPAAQHTTLLAIPLDGDVHSRHLGELGAYRLTAVGTPAGDVVVAGLPLDGVQETRWRARPGSGGSSPTPVTSCARRWRPSADTRSSPAARAITCRRRYGTR